MKKLKLFIEYFVRDTINSSFLNEDEEKKKDKDVKDSQSYKEMITMLDDPRTNEAEVMRQLWDPSPDEEDAKRSLFSKKKNGKLNDDGVPYSFDEREVSKIISIINSKIGS